MFTDGRLPVGIWAPAVWGRRNQSPWRTFGCSALLHQAIERPRSYGPPQQEWQGDMDDTQTGDDAGRPAAQRRKAAGRAHEWPATAVATVAPDLGADPAAPPRWDAALAATLPPAPRGLATSGPPPATRVAIPASRAATFAATSIVDRAAAAAARWSTAAPPATCLQSDASAAIWRSTGWARPAKGGGPLRPPSGGSYPPTCNRRGRIACLRPRHSKSFQDKIVSAMRSACDGGVEPKEQ